VVTDPLRYLIVRPWRDATLSPDAVGNSDLVLVDAAALR
jgi:hypothetical protein